MNKPFDPTLPVQTRDGRPARILCTDRKSHDYPIIALITNPDDSEQMESFTADGRHHSEMIGTPSDLINIPVKHKRDVWINVYDVCSYGYESKERAEQMKGDRRLACLKVTLEFTEGDGL